MVTAIWPGCAPPVITGLNVGPSPVEQSIAELTSTGLAHLPSGRFMANAAWLALAVITHNLGRGVGILAGHDLHRAGYLEASSPVTPVEGDYRSETRILARDRRRRWTR
jgi:hypothetical protein